MGGPHKKIKQGSFLAVPKGVGTIKNNLLCKDFKSNKGPITKMQKGESGNGLFVIEQACDRRVWATQKQPICVTSFMNGPLLLVPVVLEVLFLQSFPEFRRILSLLSLPSCPQVHWGQILPCHPCHQVHLKKMPGMRFTMLYCTLYTTILDVVHFSQCLGAAYSDCCSKYAFLHFCVKNIKRDKSKKK